MAGRRELERALAAALRRYGPGDRRVLAARNQLAVHLADTGADGEAVALYEVNARATREQTDSAAALYAANLARAYRSVGRESDALPLLVRAHDLESRARGSRHPETAELEFLTGDTLRRLGRAAEGVDWLRRGADGLAAGLGPAHELTLRARNALAMALEAAGEVDEALDVYTRAAALARPGRAPDRLWWAIHNNLADALVGAGRLDEGIAVYERTLPSMDADPSAAALAAEVRQAVCIALLDAGRLAEAGVAVAAAERLAAERLGPESAAALIARSRRAVLLRLRGDAAASRAEFEALVETASRVLGPDDLWTLRFRNGALVAAEGAPSSAYSSLAADARRALGPDHEDTGWYTANLGQALVAEGRFAAAAAVCLPIARRELARRRRGPARDTLIDAWWSLGRPGRVAAWLQDERRTLGDAVADEQLAAALAAHSPATAAPLVAATGAAGWWRARLLAAAGDDRAALAAAEGLARTAVAERGRSDPRAQQLRLGACLLAARAGQAGIARERARFTLAQCREELPASPTLLRALLTAAAVDLAAGEPGDAAELATEAARLAEELAGSASADRASALLLLERARLDLGETAAALDAALDFLAGAEPADPARAAVGARVRRAGHALPAEPSPPGPAPLTGVTRRAAAVAERDAGPEAALAARWRLAEALREERRPAEARRVLAAARAEHAALGDEAAVAEATNREAMIAEEAGDVEAAEAGYREALTHAEAEAGPDSELACYVRANLADTLERVGSLDEALWQFGQNVHAVARRAGDRDPMAIDGRRRLAWILLGVGRPQSACLIARRALADATAVLAPGADAVLEARNLLAMAEAARGEPERATALFEANLVEAEGALGAAAPGCLVYRNNLARLYLEQGRTDEALALYARSAAALEDPVDLRFAEVLRHLADALAETGRPAEAVAPARRYLGALSRGLGRDAPETQRARTRFWELALADDPDLPRPRPAVDRDVWLRLHGREAEAAVLRERRRLAEPVDADPDLIPPDPGAPEPGVDELAAELADLHAAGAWASARGGAVVASLLRAHGLAGDLAAVESLAAAEYSTCRDELGADHPRTRRARARAAALLRRRGIR